ncbi:MAG: sodium:solute symporter family protein [Candidatus Atribacteria bacterium]|nr:sodium:solute symporter family protein [Candidatus Atribacteria bacterium]
MNRSAMMLWGLLFWFLLGSLVSYLAKKRTGPGIAEYFIANRTIGGFISAMTYSATTYSAFMMVGLVGMTYSVGVSAMGFELSYLMGTLLLLVLFAPYFWAIAKKYNCISPAELLGKLYQSNLLGGIAVIFSMFMLIPYMSVQFTGIGYLLETLTGIPYKMGVFLTLIIILVFTLWAGMRSVAWTDTLQSMIMLISSILFLHYVLNYFFGGVGQFFQVIQKEHPELLAANKMPYQSFLGLTVPWLFFALTNPQVAQRMFIPKDQKSLKIMIAGFAFFGFLYTLIVIHLGLAARHILPGIINTDMITPLILDKVPAPLALLVFVGIVAASVSTVNSIILTLSSMCTVDLYCHLFKAGEKSQLLFGKVMVSVIGLLAFLFSLGKFGIIVELSVISSAGLLALVPSYFGIFWPKRDLMAALLSILVGGLTTITMYLTGYYPFGVWPGVWCIIISGIIFVVVSEIRSSGKIVL